MRLHIPALVTIVLFGANGAFVSAQSLADAAKKEEERRKAVKAAGKVYTNKDLGSLPADGAAPPPKPADAAAAKETEKPAEKEPVKDQAYWAARMNELRTQVQRDQTYVDALQTRVNSLSADFVNRDDPAQRSVIANERQKSIAELERLKAQIEAGKKAIADLEEEARRAGVPPGWLR